ncbi:ATPase [Coleofasciculus sp. FACHB-1120]|nr:ATPase [Coleofasciculus sp. FACHB-1120]
MPWAWIEQASVSRIEDFESSQTDASQTDTTFQASPLHLDSTLDELTLYNASIDSERFVEEAIQIFEANPLLPGMIITEQGNFVGMISRRRFFENISCLYNLALSSPPSLKALYSFAQCEILVCDRNTSIIESVQQSLQRSPELIHEPIVVQLQPGICRLLDVHQLLIAQSQIHQQAAEALRQSEAQSREKTTQLEQTLHELQRTQAQLIQTEKMSGLGQIVAGIAHEINNSVSFIYGNLTHASEYAYDLLHLLHLFIQHYPQPVLEIQEEMEAIDLDFLRTDLPKLLSSMQLGAERISEIVLSLRNFSRLDEAEVKCVDIHEGIDNTLLFMQNRLKGRGMRPDIVVRKDYSALPFVECNAGQLNQAFMNIFCNAIEALEKEISHRQGNTHHSLPTIRIRTEVGDNNQVLIRIADNGIGMTSEVQQRLFDPFFTTKPIGKGTGLGLSISYQIVVEKHSGQLTYTSETGKGTEFLIAIPIRQYNSSATLSQCA